MTAVRKHPDGGRQACCFSKSPPSDGHFTRSMLRIRAAPHLVGDSENLGPRQASEGGHGYRRFIAGVPPERLQG
jgi:hypothetical protein